MILGIFLYRTRSPKQFYKVTMDDPDHRRRAADRRAATSLFSWVLTTAP